MTVNLHCDRDSIKGGHSQGPAVMKGEWGRQKRIESVDGTSSVPTKGQQFHAISDSRLGPSQRGQSRAYGQGRHLEVVAWREKEGRVQSGDQEPRGEAWVMAHQGKGGKQKRGEGWEGKGGDCPRSWQRQHFPETLWPSFSTAPRGKPVQAVGTAAWYSEQGTNPQLSVPMSTYTFSVRIQSVRVKPCTNPSARDVKLAQKGEDGTAAKAAQRGGSTCRGGGQPHPWKREVVLKSGEGDVGPQKSRGGGKGGDYWLSNPVVGMQGSLLRNKRGGEKGGKNGGKGGEWG
ncbi:hypothetical protein EI94DRAFT_1698708 [Lactarius quietus]|nr:hypothetical protein EI94DRAFT_1698708 [Lactarius quietus]